MNNAYKRQLKEKLWKKDPHCHWCKCETILVDVKPHKTSPDNLATIDHLHHRFDPSGDRNKVVLSCWRCNFERGRIDEKKVPIEILRALSHNQERKLSLRDKRCVELNQKRKEMGLHFHDLAQMTGIDKSAIMGFLKGGHFDEKTFIALSGIINNTLHVRFSNIKDAKW